MIYAMIDIGSNTVRLAVYHIAGAHVEQVMKKKDTTVALRLLSGRIFSNGVALNVLFTR